MTLLDTQGQQRRRRVVARLATLGTALMLVIITMSATIRLSNAGLGCADWPRCYGPAPHQSASSPEGARGDSAMLAAARLVHRIAASAVLIVIATILFACLGSRPLLRREAGIALALAALALFLAVLGRWSMGARLPAVALGNLLGGLAMLALFWWLRLRGVMTDAPIWPGRRILRVATLIAIAVVAAQIALGGLVSASFSALACTTFPDCAGRWWPHGASWAAFDPWRDPLAGGWTPADPPAAALHMTHRLGALLSVLAVGAVALSALRVVVLRVQAAAVLILLFGQIALGVSSVLASLPLGVVLAHNVGAALLLLALVSLATMLHAATPSPPV